MCLSLNEYSHMYECVSEYSSYLINLYKFVYMRDSHIIAFGILF